MCFVCACVSLCVRACVRVCVCAGCTLQPCPTQLAMCLCLVRATMGGQVGVHSTKSLFLPTYINLGDPPQTQMTDEVKIVHNIMPNFRSVSFLLLTFIAIDMPTGKQCVVICI